MLLALFTIMTEQKLIELRDLCQQHLQKLYPNIQYPLAYYNYVGNNRMDLEDYKFDVWKHTNCLLLNYPSITVKNSANYAHTILDLWVLVVFSYYSDNVIAIRVTRMKLSERECNVSYIFSHAEYKKVEDFFNWRILCFGRGYIASYVQELTNAYTYNRLRYIPLVNYLYKYFSWESLEGGPYIKMRTIIEAAELQFNVYNNIFSKDSTKDQSYVLASLILRHKKQDIFKDVVMSYKEGTFYLTQIALRQMHYNLYKILQEENMAYSECPEKEEFVKVVFETKSYLIKEWVVDYIDNGFNLTKAIDKTTSINTDNIVLELPDREVRVAIFKDEQDKHTVKFLSTNFTIKLAAIFLRKISPINNVA
jgi:hypothetical protein